MYFYMAVCFETLDKKTSVDPKDFWANLFNFMNKKLENSI